MHSNVALWFLMRLLAAMSMSSTFWAHWSAFITLSNNSRTKLENTDRALLRPLFYSSVGERFASKIEGKISIARCSA